MKAAQLELLEIIRPFGRIALILGQGGGKGVYIDPDIFADALAVIWELYVDDEMHVVFECPAYGDARCTQLRGLWIISWRGGVNRV